MKRFFLTFVLAFVCMQSFFAIADNKILFGGALGTGAAIYGNDSVVEQANDFPRFVIEGDLFAGFVLSKEIRFNLGAVSVCDFHVKGGNHCNLIDYAFYGGIRVYPNLAGLCIGVDYMLGRRTDFVSLGLPEDGVDSTDWGNGFRFLLEYDFTAGGTGFAPVVGCGWRHMPRGGSSDNMISLYFRMSHR